MTIPLLDIPRQVKTIRSEIDAAITRVVNDAKFVLGPDVSELENEIADYCHTRKAVGVASGTDALLIALKAAGIRPGDDVVTTAYSFFATASAIWRIGARPVFADILPDTYNIDPESIARVITPKTRAILVVHLFGQMADMDRIRDAAGSIPIVEDAAQAIGATWNDAHAGSVGLAGCFSFFPSKNLGGFGDGGMIVMSDETMEKACRSLRVHGALQTYLHEEVGYNSRLDTIQAAVLRVKLKYLEDWSEQRRRNAAFYNTAFQNTPVVAPALAPEAKSIFNQYVVRVPDRDGLRKVLGEAGIGHSVYYPLPLSLQPCFKSLGYSEGDFPESEKAAQETIALPIFSELKQSELEIVAETVLSHVNH